MEPSSQDQGGEPVAPGADFKPNVIVVSGASGTGKSVLVRKAIESVPKLKRVVTCTTRKPREDEQDGVSYHFLDRAEFDRRIEQGDFIESNEIYGQRYGTSRQVFERALEEARRNREDLLLVIDVDGKENFEAAYGETISIFILPPSMKELRNRLAGRGTERADVAAKRLARADKEIARAHRYRYRVVNDSLERAVEELRRIIETERAGRDAALGVDNSSPGC